MTAENFKTCCLCFIETVSLDGFVSKQLLLEKYHFVNFHFVQMFPSQDLFGKIQERQLKLDDFDQIIIVNVRLILDDLQRLDQLGIPVRIYTSGSRLQPPRALKNVYLWNHVCTPAAKAILFDKSVGCGSTGFECGRGGENQDGPQGFHGPLNCEAYGALSCNWSAVMTILSSQCDESENDLSVLPSFLCCNVARESLFSRDNFLTTMRVESVAAFHMRYAMSTPYLKQIKEAQKSAVETVQASQHYRVFNGHEINTVDDGTIQPFWALIPAQLSNRKPRIGALIVRNWGKDDGNDGKNDNHGVGVIFHNETTVDRGDVVCDSGCQGLSGMLGLEGNHRFTFAWFASDEDLEQRFPKIKPKCL